MAMGKKKPRNGKSLAKVADTKNNCLSGLTESNVSKGEGVDEGIIEDKNNNGGDEYKHKERWRRKRAREF